MSHCVPFSMQQPVQPDELSARIVVGLIRGGVLTLVTSLAAFVVRAAM